MILAALKSDFEPLAAILIGLLCVSANAVQRAETISQSADSLLLRCTLAGNHFVYGQEIYAEVSITNLTNRELSLLAPWMQGQLRFLVDDSADLPPLFGRIHMPQPVTQILKPHDSLYFAQSIDPYYLADTSTFATRPHVRLGRHRLVARLGPSTFSNTCEYVIDGPKSADSEILPQLARLISGAMDRPTLESTPSGVHRILQKTPESAYRLDLLKAAWQSRLQLRDVDSARTAAFELFRAYPDHPAAFEVLHRMCRFLAPAARTEFLNQVIRQFPAHRVSDHARDIIVTKAYD